MESKPFNSHWDLVGEKILLVVTVKLKRIKV
jgi:hypothetical protein